MIDKRTAILYARVSTARQAAEGISLEAQRAKLEAWAKMQGYADFRFYVDEGKSGKDLRRRPEAQKAIADACESKAPLVTYSLSRLCRSIKDACAIAERLMSAEASLVSLSEQIDLASSTGRLVYHILCAVNQFVREVTSETTKDILANVKSQGCCAGEVPYGWERDTSQPEIHRVRKTTYYPHLTPVPAEQEITTKIQAERAAGRTYREIAKKLNATKQFYRDGKPWEHTDVWTALGNNAARMRRKRNGPAQ